MHKFSRFWYIRSCVSFQNILITQKRNPISFSSHTWFSPLPLALCIWLLSLTIMFSRLTQSVLQFFLLPKHILLQEYTFWLFPSLAVTNNAAVHCVDLCLDICNSTGPSGNLLKICQTLSKTVMPFYPAALPKGSHLMPSQTFSFIIVGAKGTSWVLICVSLMTKEFSSNHVYQVRIPERKQSTISLLKAPGYVHVFC